MNRPEQVAACRDVDSNVHRQPTGFVQQLPASEAHHHAGAGGLLRHGLEVVHEALRLRRTVLLPAGAPAEEVARQEDIWTYATVCAGLLHDLGKPVTDLRIIVDDEDWSPLAGPLPVGRPYGVTFQPQRRHRRHERVPPLLAPLLVPPDNRTTSDCSTARRTTSRNRLRSSGTMP